MYNLNDYMTEKLQRSKSALDPTMWEEASRDAVLASRLDVTTDDEYRIFHYIDSFAEEVFTSISGEKLTTPEEDELKLFMYSNRGKFDFNDINSFYPSVLAWINSKGPQVKTAYPEKQEIVKLDPLRVGRWFELAKEIQTLIARGADTQTALLIVASPLDYDTRYDFMSWYKFKFGTDSNKYDINRMIRGAREGMMGTFSDSLSKKVAIHYDDAASAYYIPRLPSSIVAEPPTLPRPEDIIQNQKNKDALEFARSKLVSRTFAIDKLLEKYRDAISCENFGEIEDSLNQLRKRIRGMRFATSVSDSLKKTAGAFAERDFPAGADFIREIDKRFAEDLTARGPFVKRALDQLAPMILDLQIIDGELKRRDIARALAKIDFQLAELNLAGLFTELSEAQSRLIDAYTYASNKVKEIIPKMRSTQPGASDRTLGDMSQIKTPTFKPLTEGTPLYQPSPGPTPTPAPTPGPAFVAPAPDTPAPPPQAAAPVAPPTPPAATQDPAKKMQDALI